MSNTSRTHSFVGQEVQRTEDSRLVTGKGNFIDDIRLPGMYHVAFLRSPHAHARIQHINAEKALKMEGVLAVFTGKDLYDEVSPLPFLSNVNQGVRDRENPIVRPVMQRALAYPKVCYVGEAFAAVVAVSRAVAEDALGEIEVEYEVLPPVIDPTKALDKDTPVIYEEWTDNLSVKYKVQSGNVDEALKSADYVIREKFKINRHTGNPMETRGIVTQWDRINNALTMWTSNQLPHEVRRFISTCTGFPEDLIRVIAPDVGGGFGSKAMVYPEEIAMAYMTRQLQVPLKWIEDRLEHMISTAHARDQSHEAEIGFMKDGTIVALRDKLILDTGAHNLYGVNTTYNTAAHMTGQYKIPNFECDVTVVATNKVPVSQFRGAGRPEAVFVMDRLIDLIAQKLDMDPVEVRRRNLIRKDEMPYDTGRLYKDGYPLVLDSGDYPSLFEQAVEAVGYEDIRKAQPQYWNEGRYVGVGISTYIEGTGQGPHEGCYLSISPTGQVLCAVSSSFQGQGHQTTWAQIVADYLHVDFDQIQVIGGDTGIVKYGVGTYGSRSTVIAGSAIVKACEKVKQKAKDLASYLLECHERDLEISDGRVYVKGYPERGFTYGELAGLYKPNKLPEDANLTPGLSAEEYFSPARPTYSYGVAAAVVEVDVETGFFKILKYVLAHDAGVIINPMIVEGQVAGGVAQGVGGAIYEEVVYDDHGQILTGTYMDYLIPTASEVPEVISVHMETPSPTNPLGVKGVGESGTICSAAVLASAVEDALKPLGVKMTKLPLSPNNVWKAIQEKTVS